MKRTVSLLLALALLLGLAACGSVGETVIAPGAEDGGWTGRGGPFALRKVELSGEALQLTGGGDAAYVLTSDGGFRLLCLEGGETREPGLHLRRRLAEPYGRRQEQRLARALRRPGRGLPPCPLPARRLRPRRLGGP